MLDHKQHKDKSQNQRISIRMNLNLGGDQEYAFLLKYMIEKSQDGK